MPSTVLGAGFMSKSETQSNDLEDVGPNNPRREATDTQ